MLKFRILPWSEEHKTTDRPRPKWHTSSALVLLWRPVCHLTCTFAEPQQTSPWSSIASLKRRLGGRRWGFRVPLSERCRDRQNLQGFCFPLLYMSYSSLLLHLFSSTHTPPLISETSLTLHPLLRHLCQHMRDEREKWEVEAKPSTSPHNVACCSLSRRNSIQHSKESSTCPSVTPSSDPHLRPHSHLSQTRVVKSVERQGEGCEGHICLFIYCIYIHLYTLEIFFTSSCICTREIEKYLIFNYRLLSLWNEEENTCPGLCDYKRQIYFLFIGFKYLQLQSGVHLLP